MLSGQSSLFLLPSGQVAQGPAQTRELIMLLGAEGPEARLLPDLPVCVLLVGGPWVPQRPRQSGPSLYLQGRWGKWQLCRSLPGP